MRGNSILNILRLACVALATAFAAPALAQQQVVIVTSFPKELTEAFKKAFEAKNPGIKVEILNKPTPAGVSYVRKAPATNKPDVFWVSRLTFEVPTRSCSPRSNRPPEVPAKIGNYPINDPKGYYLGQALAGYGIMEHALHESQQAARTQGMGRSRESRHFSHVAISSPSRSGTTHRRSRPSYRASWHKGWRQMLMIAGNCAAITERSFGVRRRQQRRMRSGARLLRPRREASGPDRVSARR